MNTYAVHLGFHISGDTLDMPQYRSIATSALGTGVRMNQSGHYVLMVKQILNRINQSRVGTAFIRAVQAASSGVNTILIGPDTHLDDCNARAIDRIVYFSPGEFQPRSACYNSLGQDVTEVLLHESFHAFRKITNQYDRRPLLYWSTYEEFHATNLVNMFSSEVGRNLRSSHGGFPDPSLNPNNPDVADFVRNNRSPLQAMANEHPSLCRDLAAINIRFNPFQVLLRP